MINLDIFMTLVYLSSNILRAQGKLRNLLNMYEVLISTEFSLCNSGIFRTEGIFRTKSNIYDGKFYLQPCETLAYL